MEVAHGSLMGGYLGIKMTTDRMQSAFYWPGIQGDVTRFCKSCDVCQKTVNKGSAQLGGGHWGVLETAKPKRKSSKTAKPQKNSAKTENRIQNRQKTDTMVTSGAYRANYTNTLFNQSIFGCHRLL